MTFLFTRIIPKNINYIIARSRNHTTKIKMALQENNNIINKTKPTDVLHFWFGADRWGTEAMNDPNRFHDQNPLWWGMRSDFQGTYLDRTYTCIK